MSQTAESWDEVPLSELASRITKGTTPKTYGFAYCDDGVRFVKAESLNQLRIVHSLCSYVGEDAHDTFRRSQLASNDILFTIAGTLGRVAVVSDEDLPANTNQAVAIIKLKQPEAAQFIARFLSGVNVIASGGRGTGLQNLNLEQVSAIRVPLPPLADQHRIVSTLDILMDHSKNARDKLARIPRLVERYKQAILAAAYRGDLTAEWRRNRQLPELQPSTLAAIVDAPIRNGLSVRGSDRPPGIRSLRLSALRSGIVALDDVRFLPVNAAKAERFLLREDDVLISRGNGTKLFVGLAARVQAISKQTIFPDTAFRVRLAREIARPEWFTSIWNAPQIRSQIEAAAKTTAGIWKVSQADLARIRLDLPSPAEQDQISRRIQILFSCIGKVSGEVHRATDLLNRLDQSVLAKAFRGELLTRPKVSNTQMKG